MLESDPGRARARAYDLVLNGSEIAGGSIRIHDQTLQRLIFKLLQISDDEARLRFGFFLDALEYGTPPHGGIALGLDRIIAILCGENSIRDVIAFPKTAQAVDLMAGAPSTVNQKQMKELHISASRDPYAPRGGRARVVHWHPPARAGQELAIPSATVVRKVTVPDEDVESLFGSYDENLKHLETQFGVRIRTNGHELIVEGEAGGRCAGRAGAGPARRADARRLQARQG